MTVMLRSTLVLALLVVTGCPEKKSGAEAKRVTSREELIGGPRALGEPGDWLLQNDRVRIIIQDEGFSRGFGVFGGSLIDADLVRERTGTGDSHGGTGNDSFGEMFPAFFLEALEPTEVRDPNNPDVKLPPIEIENSGVDGGPAVLVVRGSGNDFLALTQLVNENVLGDPRESPTLFFETRYILEPGVNYLRIETRAQNIAFDGRTLSWDGAQGLLQAEVPTPFGDVVLFGAGNKVFVPHEAGYDIRFGLEKIYASGAYTLPALPGIVADFIASTGTGVSYGILAAPVEDPNRNYALSTGQFPGATDHSVHVPFIASAFTGLFQTVPPPLTGNDGVPGGTDEFTFSRYFMIGNGDVASISDTVYEILDVETALLTGEVIETPSNEPVAGASIIVHDETGKKITQCTVDKNGRYRANLKPGTYRLRVVVEGRAISPFTEVVTTLEKPTFQRLTMPMEAAVTVTVIEPGVGPIPAKVSIVGVTDVGNIGQATPEYLFDLSLGEGWRFTDMVPDTEDPATREYLETFAYLETGTGRVVARPGTYEVVVSRGPEYSRVRRPVTLTAGETREIVVEIARVVDTAGYLAGDFHLHSRFSLDSSAGLHERVASYVGEGMELAVATDHNFVVDYQGVIADMQLERHLRSMIGLELTTIDRGHFNGFPLEIRTGDLKPDANDPGAYTNTIPTRTLGSFQWAKKTPDEIFSAMRALGRKRPSTWECALDRALAFLPDMLSGTPVDFRDDPLNPRACQVETEDVIVQVNHPRDSILGYFDQYGVNADDHTTKTPSGLFAPNTDQHPEFHAENFSWNFDAIEIYNGKRFDFLHSYRVPDDATIDPVSCCPVTPGNIFREFKRPYDCDPTLQDCACTQAATDAQIAAGNCEERAVAYPGAFEDWVKINLAGKRLTALGNSDSHEADHEEPGYPRSYVRVPNDLPTQVSDDDIVSGLKSMDVLMTNGPFVRVDVDGVGMGGLAAVDGGVANLNVTVDATPWVVFDHVRIYVGESVFIDEGVTPETKGEGPTQSLHFEKTYAVPVTGDTLIIVEVYGAQSLFPSVFPNEVPPLQFSDVLAAFGTAFGGSDVEGQLEPDLTFQTIPFAITNPIFIDANGDGEFNASRVIPVPGATAQTVRVGDVDGFDAFTPGPMEEVGYASSLVARYRALPIRQREVLARLPMWLWPTDRPADARRIFFQFVPHAH